MLPILIIVQDPLQKPFPVQEDHPVTEQGLSNGVIILTIVIMVGCFAVLWPKIFSPMLFGDSVGNVKLDDEGKVPSLIKSHISCTHNIDYFQP